MSTGLILLLVFFILSITGLYIYVAQSEDREQLKICPDPPQLINTEVQIAEIALNQFLAKYQTLPPGEKRDCDRDLKDLEEKLKKAQDHTLADFTAYEKASAKLKQSWRDYDEVFTGTNFFLRSLSPRQAETIRCFRTQFKSAERRYLTIEKRLTSRERIWLQEGAHKQRQQQDPSALTAPLQEVALSMDHPINITPPPPRVIEPDTPIQEEGTAQQLMDLLPHAAGFTLKVEQLNFSEIGLKKVEDANLEQSRFIGAEITGEVEFSRCNFSGADFSHSHFPGFGGIQRFSGCHFEGVSFTQTQLDRVAFYHCHFEACDFTGAILGKVKFVDCPVKDCQTEGVDFSQCLLSKSMREQQAFVTPQHKVPNRPVTEGSLD